MKLFGLYILNKKKVIEIGKEEWNDAIDFFGCLMIGHLSSIENDRPHSKTTIKEIKQFVEYLTKITKENHKGESMIEEEDLFLTWEEFNKKHPEVDRLEWEQMQKALQEE